MVEYQQPEWMWFEDREDTVSRGGKTEPYVSFVAKESVLYINAAAMRLAEFGDFVKHAISPRHDAFIVVAATERDATHRIQRLPSDRGAGRLRQWHQMAARLGLKHNTSFKPIIRPGRIEIHLNGKGR